MNKWIYSSISLNLFAFLSFLSIIWTWEPFWSVMLDEGTGRGGIIGFVFLPISFICACTLIGLYLIEILVFFLCKKYAFSFPYKQIRYKIMYYFCFYIGIFWTTWLGFFALHSLVTESLKSLIKLFI